MCCKIFYLVILCSPLFIRSQSPKVVVQLGHAFPISATDKHNSQPWIATGASDNQIKIWDYNLRKLITTLKGQRTGISHVKFMPGSTQYILSASSEDQTIVLWDILSGKKVQVYKHENSFWPTGIFFSASNAEGKPGQYFYAGHQFGIEKWETMTGKCVEKWDMDTLINDGKHHWTRNYIYVSELNCSFFTEDKTIYRFDHATHLLTIEFTALSIIYDIDYNTTKNVIAIACLSSFYVVEAKTQKQLYFFATEGNYYGRSVSLSENGNLIFINEAQNFSHIVRWKDNKDLIWFKGNSFDNAMFIEKDEYVILTGSKGYPSMYNISTLESRPFVAIDNGIKSLAFFNNGRYVLKAGNESSVRIFDLQSADYVGALEGHTGSISYTTCSKSGKYLATSSNDLTIKIWDPVSFKCLTTIIPPRPLDELFSGMMQTVSFQKIIITNDDKYVISYLSGAGVTGKKNAYLWKWELATGKLIDEYQNKIKRLVSNAFYSISDIALNPLKDEIIICSNTLSVIRCSDFKLLEKNLDKEHSQFSDAQFSPDGKLMAINRSRGVIDIWDSGKRIKLKEGISLPPAYILTIAFNNDGSMLAAGGAFDDNRVFLIDTKTFEVIRQMEGHDSWVMSVAWNNQNKLFSGAGDSKLIYWNIDSSYPEVTLVNNSNTEDYVFYNKEGNYKITRSGFKIVSFRVGLTLFPFEQFDIKFNRPDLILKSLGSDNTEMIELYRKAYEKRLKSLGLREEQMIRSFYLPQLKSPPLPYTVKEKEISLKVTASDSVYKLKSIIIRVNEIPILGKTGMDIGTTPIQLFTKDFTIPLSAGKNRIEVSCINEQGAESLRQIYEVTTSYPFPKPDLYFIGVSVSNYEDSAWNLKYAIKDGKDIATLFSKGFLKSYDTNSKENYFNELHGGVLFDTAARRDRFIQLKKFLANSKPNDHVVVFFSGHGLLDKNQDFYYATYDCDFNRPELSGLSFTDIEAVLDAAPARNKLLFIDACHSGEVDKDMTETSMDTTIADTSMNLVSYHARGSDLLVNKDMRLSLTNSFNLMKEIFAGSERGTGTVIISAAAGDSYALESDLWNNGVFTYAILNGIKNGAADADKNSEITVTELKNYLIKEVYKQTKGRQKPTCRKENLESDFRVK